MSIMCRSARLKSVRSKAVTTGSVTREGAVARNWKSSRLRSIRHGAFCACAATFLLPGVAWADICVNEGVYQYNYMSIGPVGNCSDWTAGDIIGDMPGQGTWTSIGSGQTQIVASTTKKTLAFSVSSAGNVATMTDSVNGGVLLSGIAPVSELETPST